jgi:hypothetical protein
MERSGPSGMSSKRIKTLVHLVKVGPAIAAAADIPFKGSGKLDHEYSAARVAFTAVTPAKERNLMVVDQFDPVANFQRGIAYYARRIPLRNQYGFVTVIKTLWHFQHAIYWQVLVD